MRKIILLLVVLLISGCEEPKTNRIKLEDYICTAEQLKRVRYETEICMETSYISSHCFAAAKKSQCDLKNPEKEPIK
jgi:hypothetical protein